MLYTERRERQIEKLQRLGLSEEQLRHRVLQWEQNFDDFGTPINRWKRLFLAHLFSTATRLEFNSTLHGLLLVIAVHWRLHSKFDNGWGIASLNAARGTEASDQDEEAVGRAVAEDVLFWALADLADCAPIKLRVGDNGEIQCLGDQDREMATLRTERLTEHALQLVPWQRNWALMEGEVLEHTGRAASVVVAADDSLLEQVDLLKKSIEGPTVSYPITVQSTVTGVQTLGKNLSEQFAPWSFGY